MLRLIVHFHFKCSGQLLDVPGLTLVIGKRDVRTQTILLLDLLRLHAPEVHLEVTRKEDAAALQANTCGTLLTLGCGERRLASFVTLSAVLRVCEDLVAIDL